jgi:sulfite exporter TauE/SafE
MFILIVESFLLGLSTGPYCFSQCGMVLIPYLCAKDENGIRWYSSTVLKFLSGRFVSYIFVGMFTGYLGQLIDCSLLNSVAFVHVFSLGISYFVLAMILIYNAISKRRNKSCGSGKCGKRNRIPILLGLFTGINVCPPFLLAVSKAFDTKDVFSGALFFVIFFTATSVFILPLMFSWLLNRIDSIKIIARFVSVFLGMYLAVQGIVYTISAVRNL